MSARLRFELDARQPASAQPCRGEVIAAAWVQNHISDTAASVWGGIGVVPAECDTFIFVEFPASDGCAAQVKEKRARHTAALAGAGVAKGSEYGVLSENMSTGSGIVPSFSSSNPGAGHHGHRSGRAYGRGVGCLDASWSQGKQSRGIV